MECPFCSADLINKGEYYTGRPESYYGNAANGIYYPSTKEVQGEIFKCPNSGGFEDEDEAMDYIKSLNESLATLEVDSWEDLCCNSAIFHVSGSFYTDKQGNLHDGYPC